MFHLAEPEQHAAQEKLMESRGAHCVYVTDSGGRLTMTGVCDRVRAYRDVLDAYLQIGIHAHQNQSLSVANSVVAVEKGVTRVDASLAGHGAGEGAGVCPIEPFIAVADLHRWRRTTATCSGCRTRPTTSSARNNGSRSTSASAERGKTIRLDAAQTCLLLSKVLPTLYRTAASRSWLSRRMWALFPRFELRNRVHDKWAPATREKSSGPTA